MLKTLPSLKTVSVYGLSSPPCLLSLTMNPPFLFTINNQIDLMCMSISKQVNTYRLYLHFKSICSAIFLSQDLYHGWSLRFSFRDRDDKELSLLLLPFVNTRETFAVAGSQIEWVQYPFSDSFF